MAMQMNHWVQKCAIRHHISHNEWSSSKTFTHKIPMRNEMRPTAHPGSEWANGARVCLCLLMNFNSRKFDLMLALYGEQPIN